ncbi:MAG: 4Fe-4S dicluster domain-containing protein [Sulfolobaceae archaeon]
MPIPSFEKEIIKKVLQKDKVIVDGIELDGTWNTFIVERTQVGFDESMWDEISKTLEGNTINLCWQCGTCTSGCTMREYDPNFNPRRFIDLVRKGDREALAELSDSLWRCVSCQKCTHRCPKGVLVEEVVHAIHKYAVKKGIVKKEDPGSKFDEIFLNAVMKNGGRISELILASEAMKANMITLSIKDLIDISAGILRGKLVGELLKPNRVKNWERIRKVLEEAMKEEVIVE